MNKTEMLDKIHQFCKTPSDESTPDGYRLALEDIKKFIEGQKRDLSVPDDRGAGG